MVMKDIAKAIGYTILGIAFLAIIYEVLLLCGFFVNQLAICLGINLTVVIICLTALVIGVTTQAIKNWVSK